MFYERIYVLMYVWYAFNVCWIEYVLMYVEYVLMYVWYAFNVCSSRPWHDLGQYMYDIEHVLAAHDMTSQHMWYVICGMTSQYMYDIENDESICHGRLEHICTNSSIYVICHMSHLYAWHEPFTLQCVLVCCSGLQCVAVGCSVYMSYVSFIFTVQGSEQPHMAWRVNICMP